MELELGALVVRYVAGHDTEKFWNNIQNTSYDFLKIILCAKGPYVKEIIAFK